MLHYIIQRCWPPIHGRLAHQDLPPFVGHLLRLLSLLCVVCCYCLCMYASAQFVSIPYALCPMPYALYPMPIPYTLHPIPYTLYTIPAPIPLAYTAKYTNILLSSLLL